MRFFFTMVFVSLFIATLACGCGAPGADGQQTGPAQAPGGDSISIVCTIFPQYDWARQILGANTANIELTILQVGRADLHNFQPSVSDIAKLSTCDLFIYVGGESDGWAKGALQQAANPGMVTINLLELLGEAALQEDSDTIIEDAHDEHDDEDDDDHDGDGGDDHDDEHDGDDDHDDEHDGAHDEHVWLSLRNAELFCRVIADAISTLDPGNAGEYIANLDAYCDRLSALDVEYRAVVSGAGTTTLLFGDRFPFRYLAEDYGLDFYAAFPGCSAETEASFQTIIILAEKVDEHNLKSVMVTESTDQSIAKTIISNTAAGNQQILALDSMQATTESDIQNGVTYLSIMEKNLEVLKEALK